MSKNNSRRFQEAQKNYRPPFVEIEVDFSDEEEAKIAAAAAEVGETMEEFVVKAISLGVQIQKEKEVHERNSRRQKRRAQKRATRAKRAALRWQKKGKGPVGGSVGESA